MISKPVMTTSRYITIKQMKESLQRASSSKEIRSTSITSKMAMSQSKRFGATDLLFRKVNQRKVKPIENIRAQKGVESEAKLEKTVSRDVKQDDEYIRSLYKKYLGKENRIQEGKNDKKQQQIQRKLFVDKQMTQPSQRKGLSQLYQSPILTNNVFTQQSTCAKEPKKHLPSLLQTHPKPTVKEKGSSREFPIHNAPIISRQHAENSCFNYSQALKWECLDMLGNRRSSLVRCLQSLRQLKQAVNHPH